MKKYLVLADGTVYEGEAFGYPGESVGELVFTTGMNGYIETLSDPSYAGQIVICTFPLIGNYGMNAEDEEGKPWLKGFVVREYCEDPSNFRCEETLDAFLIEKKIPGICGIDTRSLVKKIREKGVINAAICNDIPEDIDKVRNFIIQGMVRHVSCKDKKVYHPVKTKYRVVLVDFGVKRNIIRELLKRDCEVIVVPYDMDAKTILQEEPDGIVLSNGPGDPAENITCIQTVQSLIGQKPIFGICLGHQLMALAKGYSTYKMKYGHRGGNQPVKDMATGRTYITSQNHGYAVKGCTDMRFVNVNDGTCEGMEDKVNGIFTVQFHPEACAGPKDTSFLFDHFLKMMEDDYAQG